MGTASAGRPTRTVGPVGRGSHHPADPHRPGHREIDVAKKDDQHHAGGDDAEEGRDLELLQQIVERQETGLRDRPDEQQQHAAGKGDGRRLVRLENAPVRKWP